MNRRGFIARALGGLVAAVVAEPLAKLAERFRPEPEFPRFRDLCDPDYIREQRLRYQHAMTEHMNALEGQLWAEPTYQGVPILYREKLLS